MRKGNVLNGRRSPPYRKEEILPFKQREMSLLGHGKWFPYERSKCSPFERRNFPIRKMRNWRGGNFPGKGEIFSWEGETFPPGRENISRWEGSTFLPGMGKASLPL